MNEINWTEFLTACICVLGMLAVAGFAIYGIIQLLKALF